jgi:hypothetical protein
VVDNVNRGETFDYWRSTYDEVSAAVDWATLSLGDRQHRLLEAVEAKLSEPDIPESRRNLLPTDGGEQMAMMERMLLQFEPTAAQ